MLNDKKFHGTWFPPDEILQAQQTFLKTMGVFVEDSKDKSFRRTVHDAGLGAFAGGLGIGKRTVLVYSGLLYYGDFDVKAMKKVLNWCREGK